jgi:hypothetical protein
LYNTVGTGKLKKLQMFFVFWQKIKQICFFHSNFIEKWNVSTRAR